jgi:uncharacterized protein YrrD
MLEELQIGAPVAGRDGKRIGSLTHIVVEPGADRVSHVVVDPGLLESGNLLAPGGWEKPRERVLPIEQVQHASHDGLTLFATADDFDTFPLFEQQYFSDVPDQAHGRFRLGELIKYIASVAGVGAAPYEPSNEVIAYNEPAGAAEIEKDTPVWRLEPHEEIGAVEGVLLNEHSGRLAGLLLRRKGLGGDVVLLPPEAIRELRDGAVHVALSDDELDALAPYQLPQ